MAEERPHMAINFLIRAIVGIAIIFFINEFLSGRDIGLRVGMNPVTFLTSGILGIPGVALLYGITLYQSL